MTLFRLFTITGPIPSEIGRCVALYSLALQRNRLTGRIPKEIAQLPEIVHVDLGHNRLTGISVSSPDTKCCCAFEMFISALLLNLSFFPAAGTLPEQYMEAYVERQLNVQVQHNRISGRPLLSLILFPVCFFVVKRNFVFTPGASPPIAMEQAFMALLQKWYRTTDSPLKDAFEPSLEGYQEDNLYGRNGGHP